MELGIYSFGDRSPDPTTGPQVSVAQTLANTLERIKLADELGLGFYGLGEHHLDNFAISNPGTVLAAAASVTRQITLSSAVTVLSTEDPVRLYQQFTTLDQLSGGRAELLAGRGSFTESFPLFGADLEQYDDLFEEKLALLLHIDRNDPLTWSGKFHAPLTDAHILPRPYRDHLRISIGTGGNPESSIRAGLLGLPVVYAIIGGRPERFAPLVDLYRQAGEAGGHTERRSARHAGRDRVHRAEVAGRQGHLLPVLDADDALWRAGARVGAAEPGRLRRGDPGRGVDLRGQPRGDRRADDHRRQAHQRRPLRHADGLVGRAARARDAAIELLGTEVLPLVRKEFPITDG